MKIYLLFVRENYAVNKLLPATTMKIKIHPAKY